MTFYPPGPPASGQPPSSGGDPFGGTPFSGTPFGASPQSGPPVYTTPGPAPQPPANTLATLSLIFAVVFAPAGAILGHLGLSQIARTGERGRDRALIGLSVSYVVIVACVIGLVFWTVGDPARPPTARPAAAPQTGGPPAATPTAVSGRINAPLLSVDEVKRVLTNPPPGGAAPPALATLIPTAIFSSPVAANSGARVDPAECAPTFFAGTGAALDGTGYLSVSGASMQGAGPYAPQAVTEVVVTYPDPGSASRAVDIYTAKIDQCKANSGKGFKLIGADGSPQGQWFGGTSGKAYSLLGMTYHAIHTQQLGSTQGAAQVPKPDFYTNKHVIATKGSSLIDVSASGTGLYFQAVDLTRMIADQVT